MPQAHSKVAVAACVGGAVTFVLYLLSILYIQLGFRFPEVAAWSGTLGVLLMGFVLFVPIPVHAVGIVMGAVSLFFPERKKHFPLLALASNAVFALLSLFPWLYLGWLGLHTGVK